MTSAISFSTFLLMFQLVLLFFTTAFNLLDGIYIWEALSILDLFVIFMYLDLTVDFVTCLVYGDY